MTKPGRELSAWQLRFDLLSTRALVFVLNADGRGTPKPEVHLFLGDRHERLARYHRRRGAKRRADRLDAKARCQ